MCNVAIIAVSVLFYSASPVRAFSPNSLLVPTKHSHSLPVNALGKTTQGQHLPTTISYLKAQGENTEAESEAISFSSNDQLALGVVGTKMSLIMLVSEYVLKTTGCGLPAGPYGLIGAAEGISYLGVTALVAFSLYASRKMRLSLDASPKTN